MPADADVAMTPIYKKPEFWISMATNVAGLLLALGVVTPLQGEAIGTYIPNIVGGLMSLVSSIKIAHDQTVAKVEVFRAMCALSSSKTGEISAQSALICGKVVDNARTVGL